MTTTSTPQHQVLAATPPMGWNSFDCYGSSVTEAEIKANADYMAAHLSSHGWEYVVVDFCWSHPDPGAVANPDLEENAGGYLPLLYMDGYGRLLPAPERFPSATDGRGFKPLADYVHSKGLKFGIHVMRGIPRQAALQKLPILNTGCTADEVADHTRLCNWLNHMYGINPDQTGAQAYYDSIFALYAEWEVDYVKVDDLVFPYHAAEIEAIHHAVANCGRPMVLSLSCGPAPLDKATHLQANSNLWRISADFWDDWTQLKNHFSLCSQWAQYSIPGHWADADMLPLGRICIRGPKGEERRSRYTQDEQTTLITLFTIMRSPLMFGGDMPSNDAFTLALLSNDEVLAVNQHSTGNQMLFTKGEQIAWFSNVPDSPDKYLALFNLADEAVTGVQITFEEIHLDAMCRVRDLWQQADLGEYQHTFMAAILPHGAKLYRITPL